MAAQNELLRKRVPILTLLMVLGAAVVYAVPGLSRWMIYDRAAILKGELWRLLTGHWVHFSASHLTYDLLSLGIAGWIIESRGYRRFGLLCVLSALAIGVAMLALEPEMTLYGGLSGVATAAVVFLALHGTNEAPPWRWICVAVLMASLGKILFETFANRFQFVSVGDMPFLPVPASHAVGGLTAVFIYVMSGQISSRENLSVRAGET